MIRTEDIKEMVDIAEAVQVYGVKLKHGMGCCPFHDDSTPSFSVKNGRYKCFACGAGGDVIDFVSRITGLGFADTLNEINNRFALGLSEKKSAAAQLGILERQKRKRKKELFKAWQNRAFDILNIYCKQLRRVLRKGYADSDEYLNAVMRIDKTEYMLDILTFGTDREVSEMYKFGRKEVDEIAGNIGYRF